MSNTVNRGGGFGTSFVGLLQIVFIVLKLTGHITWSWFWVLSPIWITILLVVLLLWIIFKFS